MLMTNPLLYLSQAKRAGISKDSHSSNHVSSDLWVSSFVHSMVIGLEHVFGKAKHESDAVFTQCDVTEKENTWGL